MQSHPSVDHATDAETATRTTVMLLVNGLEAGGQDRRFVELARGLDKDRFRVIVAVLKDCTLIEDELRGTPGVEVRSVGARGRWDARAVFGLASLLRRERVDVLQTMFSPAMAFGLMAATMARTPVRIATPSGDASGRPGRMLEKMLRRSATAFVSDSEKSARRMIAGGAAPERVSVIYDGVPAESLRTNLREREAVRAEHGVLDESWLVGVVADITAELDLGCFLQAASIVRAEVPGTKFMFVGEGPQKTELQRRATILGLDGSVVFAGNQPNLASYVAAMDVAVLPGDAAPFGLQAMGLGRPIVAMDSGANGELFPMGEAGLVVPPDNSIILAHAVLEVMKHPDAVERIRQRGREIFNERFTMARMVASYEELYTELWDRHQSGRVTTRSRREESSV